MTLAATVALCSVPAFAQDVAQPASPLTHAQVMDQLYQLESVGYDPTATNYPGDIDAAERRLALQQAEQKQASDHSVTMRANHSQ
ncbi:hypothetical protein AYM40_07065 [Paraburkholderia phytofirmans OLGA172]|uniref:DUF4148 domain-containing protein n=1 Tax=Paraburkholderia phytofirmans OLGA172 TaxID=1417228 RepID=A0A160FPK8_9BURK|nr:hypothetical protein AYM40_07065 [Paraburkholderia phytofirmans OLGA172]